MPPGASEKSRAREGDGPRIFSSSSASDLLESGLPFVSHTAWDPARKVRFLDHLAGKGDVRAACAAVGMSRTSAYLLRRRDGLFAQGWAAALVLARAHVEEVLATRALDGVEEAVWFRGECVGTRRRFDTRLLLAHLGRLDRAAQDMAGAVATGVVAAGAVAVGPVGVGAGACEGGGEDLAARFDEVLALVAGEHPGADLVDLAMAGEACGEAESLPPGREAYVCASAGAAFDAAREAWLNATEALDAGPDPAWPRAPDPAAFRRASAGRWDAWQARAFARVDAMAGMEFKSLPPRSGEDLSERGGPSGRCKPCKPRAPGRASGQTSRAPSQCSFSGGV
ncbi:hypothetical protein [Novosphingobium sp. BL-52-GroH]|uniref:hypothetical protein n=1 Tax=Novosphingobium sp. BL-52-GroH TaxID=3349877 RepID=UPI00384E091E